MRKISVRFGPRMAVRLGSLVAAGALIVMLAACRATATSEGFALAPSRIPPNEIQHGGPGKDGIPALVRPHVLNAADAAYLRASDRVLGLEIGTEARAYPVRILNWHEVVNDVLGGTPVLVTYCPLCASGLAFRREVAGKTLEFGVSGLLYQSNVLMYDRTHLGLWSQLQMEAVTGPLAGTALEPLPLQVTTWAAWRDAHPSTSVLSPDTGYTRSYGRDPYRGYADVPTLMFPVRYMDGRRDPKDLVVGIVHGGVAKAYPLAELAKAPRPLRDTVGGRRFVLHYDPRAAAVTVRDERGATVPATVAFWFAWLTFHPGSELFTAAQPAATGTGGPPAPPDARALLPLATGKWWVYEERVASGEVAATERWKVRARRGNGYVLTTRQRRTDNMHASWDVTRDDPTFAEERLEIRPDGVVRTFPGAATSPMYLLHTPIEIDRSWSDAGGHCGITAVDASVRAAGRAFTPCVQVTCEQGQTVRIVSSYAPGVGLVRQDLWYGGLGPVDSGGDFVDLTRAEHAGSASSTLVLKAWGVHAADPR